MPATTASHSATPDAVRSHRRRWTWEHVALVWLLAMGLAVACTLARFPPGRPLRLVRVPPRAWRAQMGPRWLVVVADRERLLVAGWIVGPLVATVTTLGWAVRRSRDA